MRFASIQFHTIKVSKREDPNLYQWHGTAQSCVCNVVCKDRSIDRSIDRSHVLCGTVASDVDKMFVDIVIRQNLRFIQISIHVQNISSISSLLKHMIIVSTCSSSSTINSIINYNIVVHLQ